MGGPSILISAFAAVLAGLAIAAGGVLQQKAASRRPSGERMSIRLMARLVADRVWLLGIGLAVVSYGFQAIALTFGPLTLVQPLIVSELLFAVPVSVRLRKLRLRPRDWGAILSVVAGLTVGIVAADPGKGNPVQPITMWAPAIGGVAVLSIACVVAARWLTGPTKSSAFALSGACTMALQSALYAATLALLRQRGWGLFLTWEPYVLVAASLAGMFLIQNAFESGPLAASTPVIDAVLPLVAIALGVGLFGEPVRTSLWGLGGAGLGIVLLLVGIVALDTSPVVRKEQRLEQKEKEETKQQEDVQEQQAQ
ncbi:MAG TPA: DMT family transporter [Nocardioidaceae bacterium]|nr:DMT family transporter [Nocardioidaceae bacterium]